MATDNFNRADNADLGASWDVTTGENPFKIVSNQIQPNSLAADSNESNNSQTFGNDQFSQATLIAVTGSVSPDDAGIGVCVRCAAAANTFYRFIAGADGSILAKVNAGVYTKLASNATTWAANDVIRVEANGTSITGFKNGTSNLSTTDSAITAGRAGISYSGALSAATMDDWSGDTLSTSIIETNTNSAGLTRQPRLRGFRFNHQGGDVSGPLPTQPETNVAIVGKFRPVKMSSFAFNFPTPDTSGPIGPQPDSVPNVIGKFSAPRPKKFSLGRVDDVDAAVAAQPETNVSIVGKFNARRPSRFAFNTLAGDTSGPLGPQPGDDSDVYGVFKPTKLRKFAHNTGGCDDVAFGQNPDGSNITVIVFDAPRAPVAGPSFFMRSAATDLPVIADSAQAVARANPSKISARTFNQQASDDQSTQEPGAHPSHVGKFTAPKLRSFRLGGMAADDSGPLGQQPDTQGFVVGKFRQPPLLRFSLNSFPTNAPAPPEPETNTHAVARFVATKYRRFAYNFAEPESSGPVGPQPDSAGAVVGRMSAPPLRRFRHNLSDSEAPQPAQAETNQNFAGRFRATALAQFRMNHSGCDDSAPQPTSLADTRPAWRFAAPTYRRFSWNTSDNGFAPPQPETNRQFIGRHRPTRYSSFRLSSWRDDSGPLATQPHGETAVVGKFRATKYSRFAGNHMAPARDTGIVPPNQNRTLRLSPRGRVLILTDRRREI